MNSLVRGNREIVGTCSAIRSEIMGKVFEENGESIRLRIDIYGRTSEIDLKREYSCSGKSTWYSAKLNLEQFSKFHSADRASNEKGHFGISLDSDGNCFVGGTWTYTSPSGRHRKTNWDGRIPESCITIL